MTVLTYSAVSEAEFSGDDLVTARDSLSKCVKTRRQATKASALEADTSPETHQELCGLSDTIRELALLLSLGSQSVCLCFKAIQLQTYGTQ